MKADYEGGLSNLKKKAFCHPGFKYYDVLTPVMLQELEVEALNKSNIDICNSDDVTVEKHIKAIASFFGDSCRPGRWTTNANLEKYLSKYDIQVYKIAY